MAEGKLDSVCRLRVELYGSMALTGKGHGTDRAITLGLAGEEPHTVDPFQAESALNEVRQARRLELLGKRAIAFDEGADVISHCDRQLPFHPNGMKFSGLDRAGEILLAENFYSIGGGFVVGDNPPAPKLAAVSMPYEFRSAAELLELCKQFHLPIWKLMQENESASRSAEDVGSGIDRTTASGRSCRAQPSGGMTACGTLPGHLKVRRRAQALAARLHSKPEGEPLAALDWVSVYAIAINE